jgi:hypothetical protein|tara:strand:- start:2505 stop:2765 length:261 start_codon:yes stop_codon:yes gene_type:complete
MASHPTQILENKRMYQSNLLRELCDANDVNAFGLRQHVLRTNQHHSNWDLIKCFCRQELADVEGVNDLFHKYYDASTIMANKRRNC